jgi:hypothetical protein
MRPLNPLALGVARLRADEMMTRIARALVDAELGRPPTLDAAAAVRFLDELEGLLERVPFAALRLTTRLAAHPSPAVRRATASATRLLLDRSAGQAEAILSKLAGCPEAPVRSAVVRSLIALVGASEQPMAVVERWITGSPAERDAIERARRRLPAPTGTAPTKH